MNPPKNAHPIIPGSPVGKIPKPLKNAETVACPRKKLPPRNPAKVLK